VDRDHAFQRIKTAGPVIMIKLQTAAPGRFR